MREPRMPLSCAVMWVTIGVSLAGCGMPLGRELFAHGGQPGRAQAIVVLGNRPPRGSDGQVAAETARRVRRGVELYQAGLAPHLWLAGGPAPGGGTEAEVMADYAAALGVPRAALRLERASRDTIENARNTYALICAEQAPSEIHGPCEPHVLVVTSAYHLRRALRAFRCAGFVAQGIATELPDDAGYQASWTAYEYVVGVANALSDPCGRARGRQAR